MRSYERFKIVRLNLENPKTAAILKALAILKNMEIRSFVAQEAKQKEGDEQSEDSKSL